MKQTPSRSTTTASTVQHSSIRWPLRPMGANRAEPTVAATASWGIIEGALPSGISTIGLTATERNAEAHRMTNNREGVHQFPTTSLTEMRRRDFLAVVATTVTAIGTPSWAVTQPRGDMYGVIGKINAISGKREELIAILLDGVVNMPGCLSYIVAKDTSDADAIWISEAWDSQASHEASLSLPSVKEAMTKGRPLIAGFSDRVVTTPVGGYGLRLPKCH